MPPLPPICTRLSAEMADLNRRIAGFDTIISNPSSSRFQRQDAQAALTVATQELAGLRQQWLANGCDATPRRPTPLWPVVRILIVLDGKPTHWGSFGPGDPTDTDYFGLSEVLRTLNDRTAPFPAYFSITKAHRDQDPLSQVDPLSLSGLTRLAELSPDDQALFRPDYEGFHFDQHDLSVFDEIWLFGVGGGSENETRPLTDPELKAIARFMGDGGGVFATGDHEDLGAPLCGRVPRVRSMRKWYDAPGPLGEPVAPPALGMNRIDTTRVGHNDPSPIGGASVIPFDNQSDDIPQEIVPVTFPYWAGRFLHFTHHPLLDYPGGVMNVLPDHMHEGQVITPWNYNQTLTFDTEDFVEYPSDAEGYQIRPVIVAYGSTFAHYTSHTENHRVDSGYTANTLENSLTFGVIGAYDGHLVEPRVGRVVVDSTWHHFFDINLIGDPLAPSPKNAGFNASPEGRAALAKIQRYYRNIALWLARDDNLSNFFATAAHRLAYSQPLNMVLSTTRKFTARELLDIGALGRSALERLAPTATQIDWLFAHLRAANSGVSVGVFRENDDKEARTNKSMDLRVLLEAALGGAIVEVGQKLADGVLQDKEGWQDELRKIVDNGVRHGFKVLSQEIRGEAAKLFDAAEELELASLRTEEGAQQ